MRATKPRRAWRPVVAVEANGCGRRTATAAAAVQQCADAMNTVRSCIAAAYVLLIAFGSRATFTAVAATECCKPNSGGGGGVTAAGSTCRNGNRTFQAIETYGGGPCDDNVDAVPVRKCCPANQTYDPEVRFCRPATAVAAGPDETVDAAFRRLLLFEGRPFPPPAMVGYDFEPPKCASGYMLTDVPADDVRRLLDNVTETGRQPFPADHCFDLTSQWPPKLVARTCRPRDQYCRGNYTCANKCCRGDRMIVGV